MELFIPPEIHHVIVRYLDDDDLRSMRLVSKMLADIATKLLFRVVKIHASQDSFFRLVNLSKHEGLRSHVQTMVWDTNLWDLRAVETFEDFMTFVHETPGRPTSKPAEYDELGWKRRDSSVPSGDDLRVHFKKYQSRVEEEWALLQGFKPLKALDAKFDSAISGGLIFDSLSDTLSKFPSLKKVFIVNGDVHFKKGRIIKENEHCGPPSDGEIIARGETLHFRNMDDYGAGVHEFWTMLLAAPQTTKLRVDALHHTAFCEDHPSMIHLYEHMISSSLFGPLGGQSRRLPHPCQNLTSLHLTITTLDGNMGEGHSQPGTDMLFLKRLHALLRGWTKLQSLHISLERRIRFMGISSAAIIIRDGIVPRHTWSCLRKLSLAFLDMSPDQLKDLLFDHSESLEELRLDDICLDTNLAIYNDEEDIEDEDNDPGDWIELMSSVRERMHLKRARFDGCLYSSPELLDAETTPFWRMTEDDLGPALSQYLVHGGENPLTLENARDPSEDEDENEYDYEGPLDWLHDPVDAAHPIWGHDDDMSDSDGDEDSMEGDAQ